MCIDRVVSGGNLFCPSPTEFEKKRMDKKSKEGKRGKNGKKREKLAKMLHIAKMGSKKI